MTEDEFLDHLEDCPEYYGEPCDVPECVELRAWAQAHRGELDAIVAAYR